MEIKLRYQNSETAPPVHTQINPQGRGLLSCLVLQAGASQYTVVHNTMQLAMTKHEIRYVNTFSLKQYQVPPILPTTTTHTNSKNGNLY